MKIIRYLLVALSITSATLNAETLVAAVHGLLKDVALLKEQVAALAEQTGATMPTAKPAAGGPINATVSQTQALTGSESGSVVGGGSMGSQGTTQTTGAQAETVTI